MPITFNGNIQLIGKQPLSVTENGTYNAPNGKAYDPVTVNVSGGGGQAEEQLKGLIERTATHIDIPQGTTILGLQAFSRCSSLVSISIPSSVLNIGQAAFSECISLETITCDFAAGAVSGAPWGAPSTTQIIYLR